MYIQIFPMSKIDVSCVLFKSASRAALRDAHFNLPTSHTPAHTLHCTLSTVFATNFMIYAAIKFTNLAKPFAIARTKVKKASARRLGAEHGIKIHAKTLQSVALFLSRDLEKARKEFQIKIPMIFEEDFLFFFFVEYCALNENCGTPKSLSDLLEICIGSAEYEKRKYKCKISDDKSIRNKNLHM